MVNLTQVCNSQNTGRSGSLRYATLIILDGQAHSGMQLLKYWTVRLTQVCNTHNTGWSISLRYATLEILDGQAHSGMRLSKYYTVRLTQVCNSKYWIVTESDRFMYATLKIQDAWSGSIRYATLKILGPVAKKI